MKSGLNRFIDDVIIIAEDEYIDPVYPERFVHDVMIKYEEGYTEQVTAYDLAKQYNWRPK